MVPNPADNTKKFLAIVLGRTQRARLMIVLRHGVVCAVCAYLPAGEAAPMKKLRFIRDEFGTTAIEYGLIGALISVVCIVGMTFVGAQLQAMYNAVSVAITPAL